MKHSLLLTVVFAFAAGLTPARAITIDVVPALAPNSYASPSYPGWQANAIYALAHGLPAYGDPGSPTYYQAGANYYSAQVIVTGFNSWMGQVDPGTVYGAAYANEFGNRMTFGVAIDGEGAQFSISQLSFTATSTNALELDFGRATGSYSYDAGFVGVLAGADGILWTGDDTYVTSAPNTQLVDGLVGRGSGSSFAAYCPGCSLADEQAALLSAAGYPGVPYSFTGTYSLAALASGSGTFQIDSVPEPGTFGFVAGAAILLGAFRRRLLVG
jgi:hypothetical protein